jgi:hypothetical protein
MASINEFIALVKGEGLARSNRYLVIITPPASLISDAPDDKLTFYCDSVSMPGMNLLSNPTNTFGEQREVVYNRSFEPVNLEFILDQEMEIKKFFDEWQARIVNPVSRMIGYYQDYIGRIEIQQLDFSENESPKYAMKLYEAFPKSVAAINFSSGSKDVTKLSVSIEYKYWRQLTIDKQEAPRPSPVPTNSIGSGVSSANLNPRLSGQNVLDVPNQASDEAPQ